MGRFFTSTQIYNPKHLDHNGFKAYFCEKMKKEGYEICEADCAELSYVLAFADNCKWVTLSSEAYEQGNRTSQTDTARIAKMLGTYCVNTIVIDSDCAMLDLYDDKGKKADTVVMGRADDYLGDDIPTPVKSVWEQFVSPDSTWEKFISVVQGDYIFVEDGLSELAPVIGMDSGNILFEYEDVDESNGNICYLSFRKRNSKKEKKFTLQSGFKSTYKELLEPKGFSLIKSKHPYFIRVTNDGIVHSVSFAKEKSFSPESEGFSICIGISLISLPLIDYNKSPTTLDNQKCMMLLRDFFHKCSLHLKGFDSMPKKCSVFYKKGNIEEMLEALMKSQRELMPFVLDFFDRYTTLDDMYQLGEEMSFGVYRDVVILKQKVDEYLAEREKKFPEQFQQMVSIAESNPMMRPMLEATKKKAIDSYERINQWFLDRKIGGVAYEEYMLNDAEMREKNYQILKELGEDSSKKEKKLTLNTAFKQVFGETLEPLGFIKAKTRHPCFLRAVGDEIIHVINLSCCGTRISTASGVMTVYRPQIDLNDHKWDNKWLNFTEKFYSKINVFSFDEKYWNENLKIEYTLGNEESLIIALKKALEEVKKWVLPILDDVKTVKDIIDYQHRMGVTTQYFAVCDNAYLNHETPCSDGAILFALDDPYYYPKRIKELLQAQLDFEIEHGIHFFGKETYEETCERFDKNLTERIAQIEDVINNKYFYEQTLAELERRKTANTKILNSYGLNL